MSQPPLHRVLTIGTFDAFHIGHVELLRECLRLAGSGPLFVGVNADEFTHTFKKVNLRQTLIERMATVRMACPGVSVLPHWSREYTPDFIEFLRPDIIAVGDDWQGRDYLGQLGVTQDWLDDRGISVEYIPRTTGVSSTQIRARAV